MSQLNNITSKLKLPLIAAPMFLVSGPELVIAACKAGIVGSFPAPNARTPEIFAQWLEQIKTGLEGTDAVWAVNLVMHSSYPRRLEDLAMVAKAQPPLVITALGSPKDAIETVHGYGGLVFADVNNVEYARKAAAAGADGLVLVSSGAGGHTGQVSGFAFVDSVREFFDGPIVLAGSISTGRGIRAAEVLGADLAYMGTKFIAAEESMALPDYKKMIVEAGPADIVCSAGITGVPANWLRQSLIGAGYNPDNMAAVDKPDFNNPHQDKKAWKHVWSAGQGVGTIHQVEPMADIVNKLIHEYEDALNTPAFNKK
ncbi:MAG: nitronate monooxygenase [Aliidiomarina sp.]|uniref:NAD(P)H-dependent flavin oxidoreductase n=1 Tax=Aliidiomarina sp. TaxID=1872439 RepID=UPI0025C03ED0|nr:nitronate monooxygenase [Aliidiomarina sp.]MCH8501190.1 nitronate monooxygenase [Aliidiomarina sp.]